MQWLRQDAPPGLYFGIQVVAHRCPAGLQVVRATKAPRRQARTHRQHAARRPLCGNQAYATRTPQKNRGLT